MTYTAREHDTWRTLYARQRPLWQAWAHPRYLEGHRCLALDADRVPDLDAVNRFLCPRTGFRATPVPGYVPAFQFFDSLRRREFPTVLRLRSPDQLDYLPEPDVFHDVAGHVPLHTDPAFAETLVHFGECARKAASRGPETLASNVRAMARFFWFTVEFGLMESPGGLKAYGSGLLSSHSELEHALVSPDVQRYPFQLEWVVNQCFEIDHFQPLLFSVRSFDHLYDQVKLFETWLDAGRLDHVAPGEPEIAAADLESFLVQGCPTPVAT